MVEYPNFSITIDPNKCTGITDTCFDWCKSQHFVNDFADIKILLAAIIFLYIAFSSYQLMELHPILSKIVSGAILAAIFCIVAFCYITLKWQ